MQYRLVRMAAKKQFYFTIWKNYGIWCMLLFLTLALNSSLNSCADINYKVDSKTKNSSSLYIVLVVVADIGQNNTDCKNPEYMSFNLSTQEGNFLKSVNQLLN